MKKVTKTNDVAQVEGTWTDVYEDISLLIARSDGANPQYERALQKGMAPYKKKMDRGKSMDNATAKRVMIKVTAESVLLGWNKKDHEGEMVLDDDDNPAKYNMANAIKLLTIDPDLRKFVDEFSSDIDNYLDVEEIAGK